MMQEYPNIDDVVYLSGHDLLIRFSNGEDRICDMSQFFAPSFSKEYYQLPVFKDFSFKPSYIAWGNDEYTIGVDSLYNSSRFLDDLSKLEQYGAPQIPNKLHYDSLEELQASAAAYADAYKKWKESQNAH
jgi:hypothetical protein